MSALKVIAGTVAVGAAVVVGYKALKAYQIRRTERKIDEVIKGFEKIFEEAAKEAANNVA